MFAMLHLKCFILFWDRGALGERGALGKGGHKVGGEQRTGAGFVLFPFIGRDGRGSILFRTCGGRALGRTGVHTHSRAGRR